jgi:hypothetical protein
MPPARERAPLGKTSDTLAPQRRGAAPLGPSRADLEAVVCETVFRY